MLSKAPLASGVFGDRQQFISVTLSTNDCFLDIKLNEIRQMSNKHELRT